MKNIKRFIMSATLGVAALLSLNSITNAQRRPQTNGRIQVGEQHRPRQVRPRIIFRVGIGNRHDNDFRTNIEAYQEGYADGRRDRRYGMYYRPYNSRISFRNGYRQGYDDGYYNRRYRY